MIANSPQIWLLAAIGLLATAGCHPRGGRTEPRPRELMHTGFEDFAGWGPKIIPLLVTNKAHSGKFALRVDPQHPYSPTFRADLGQLCPNHRPRRLTLSAWVWVPSYSDEAMLVAAISNPGDLDHPVLHKEVFLNDSRPFRQWKLVSRDIDLPSTLVISSKSQLVIYLWNAGASAPVYADDLLLTELW